MIRSDLILRRTRSVLLSLTPAGVMLAVTVSLAPARALADDPAETLDGAYLDPKPTNLIHPVVDDTWQKSITATRSDVGAMLNKMTPVKSQGSRGTCSIFSATAMLEAMLVINKGFSAENTDLSEEWLQYLIMRNRQSDGSNGYTNLSTIVRSGMPTERELPYIGETWTDTQSSPLAAKRCGHLSSPALQSCLLGHRDPTLFTQRDDVLASADPELHLARKSAREFRDKYLVGTPQDFSVLSTSDAKTLLRSGVPLILELEFFYGAWNHRKADSLGIERDLENWNLGIIGYPEQGSMDRQVSPSQPAGHSVLVVGYDDDAIVSTRVKMADGSYKKFEYRGVYFIKNSWGAGSFGVTAKIGGKTAAGYGVITQKYSHEYGSFFKLPMGR